MEMRMERWLLRSQLDDLEEIGNGVDLDLAIG